MPARFRAARAHAAGGEEDKGPSDSRARSSDPRSAAWLPRGGSAWDSRPRGKAVTQNKDRKARIRARMAQTGEPYTEAARQVDAEKHPDPREREWKIGRRMHASRFPMSRAAAAILVDREAAGLPEAPADWRSAMPHMASTYRAGDVRAVEVLDAATNRVAAKITVPYQDPDELEAGYRADMAADPDGGGGYVSGYALAKARLGRPDLVLHQLGWESLADWSEWPDGRRETYDYGFARPYTSSIEAALTLVPENFSYELTQSMVEPPRFARARLWDWRRGPTGIDPSNEWKAEGNRPLAVNICIAALKLLVEQAAVN